MRDNQLTPEEIRNNLIQDKLEHAKNNVYSMRFYVYAYMEQNYTPKEVLIKAIRAHLKFNVPGFKELSEDDQKEIEKEFTEWFNANWVVGVVLDKKGGTYGQ